MIHVTEAEPSVTGGVEDVDTSIDLRNPVRQGLQWRYARSGELGRCECRRHQSRQTPLGAIDSFQSIGATMPGLCRSGVK